MTFPGPAPLLVGAATSERGPVITKESKPWQHLPASGSGIEAMTASGIQDPVTAPAVAEAAVAPGLVEGAGVAGRVAGFRQSLPL